MGEVRSQGVCDKSSAERRLKERCGRTVWTPSPSARGRATTEGRTLCSCQLLILQAGEQQKTYSLLADLPLPPRLISMLQGAVAPITPSLLPVSGPSRARQTRPTDSLRVGSRHYFTGWILWLKGSLQVSLRTSQSQHNMPHLLVLFLLRLTCSHIISFPRGFICLSDCRK